ncbi:MAG: hypothetical protein AAF490_09295 [Chloroflexota bacterium]
MIYPTVYLARADLLNRLRRPAFLFVIALAAYASYLFVPPATAVNATIVIGQSRLFYDSAGVGFIFAVLLTYLALPAFFFVRGNISQDTQTKHGFLVAPSRISSASYLLGKWLSNMGMLTLLLLTVSVMAIVMLWTRGETNLILLSHLVLPIWLIGLPLMSFVAGLAILFETVPLLRGTLGSLVYFVLWINGIESVEQGSLFGDFFTALVGILPLFESINPNGAGVNIGSIFVGSTQPFVWQGYQWTAQLIGARLVWISAGLLFALSGLAAFDRFQRNRANWLKQQLEKRIINPLLARFPKRIVKANVQNAAQLTPVGSLSFLKNWLPLIKGEILLNLKGQPYWWYLVAAGCFFYGLLPNETETVLQIKQMAIVPIIMWSGVSARMQQQVNSLLLSAPFVSGRHLLAAWSGSVVVSWLVFGGAGLSLLLSGQITHLFGLIVATLFVPAFALALGTFMGARRTFELVYLLWWYLINTIVVEAGTLLQLGVVFDFMSTTPEAIVAGMPFVYAVATGVLLGIAALGRIIRPQ